MFLLIAHDSHYLLMEMEIIAAHNAKERCAELQPKFVEQEAKESSTCQNTTYNWCLGMTEVSLCHQR